MQETAVHEWVLANLPGHHVRIENAVSSGIFDLNTCHKGHEHWIEYKIRDGNRIKVRGTQFVWGSDRIAAGAGNLWFLVRRHSDPKAYLYDARTVLARCDPAYNDGKAHMLVDLSPEVARAIGREPIRKLLFGY
jgi:hypothetical protein